MPFWYRSINVTFEPVRLLYLCISFLIVCLIVLHSVPSGVGFFLPLPHLLPLNKRCLNQIHRCFWIPSLLINTAMLHKGAVLLLQQCSFLIVCLLLLAPASFFLPPWSRSFFSGLTYKNVQQKNPSIWANLTNFTTAISYHNDKTTETYRVRPFPFCNGDSGARCLHRGLLL